MSKRIWIFIFCLALLIFAAGCGNKKLNEAVEVDQIAETSSDYLMRETLLYYLDENEYLVPVQAEIPWEEGIGKAALSRLIAGSDDELKLNSLGLFPPVPSGVTFDLDITDQLATVDILTNGEKLPSGKKKKTMFACISNTLLCFETVDTVTIRIDGDEVQTSSSEDIASTFVEAMANVEPLGSDPSDEVEYANLYFISGGGSYLVPVKRLTSDLEPVTVVNELLIPASNTTLTSTIPPTVDVLGITVENAVATIDFSAEFDQLSDDPDQERMTLFALTSALTSLDEVDSVQVFVEGKAYEGVVETVATGSFYNILD